MSADLVFTGGTVVTVDEAFSCAEALAVEGPRIAAVGTAAEVLALAGPQTRVVDLAGGALLPGINDSHLHAAMLGAYWPSTWMDGLATGGGLPTPRTLDTAAERTAALERAFSVALSLGITSYTEPGLGPGADHQHGGSCGAAILETYVELAGRGRLPVRVNALLLFGELDGPSGPDALERGLRELELPAVDPEWLRIAGVKVFADGIPPMRTAWMDEPYPDGSTGSLLVRGADDEERVAHLERMLAHAHGEGHQIGVHATGSRTITATVSILAGLVARTGRRDLRHYVIHGDCASGDALATMARHEIGLNSQPGIYEATAPMLAGAIGAERAEAAFPVRSALAAGIPVCLSSDGPVIAPDWRQGVAAAVGRAGGERLALEDAIRGYTINGARQDRAESWKGSLEAGKVADLCVLDRDPLTVELDELAAIEVRMTVVDGIVAFES